MHFQNMWGKKIRDHGLGVLIQPLELIDAWTESRTNLLVDALKRIMDPASTYSENAVKTAQLARSSGGVEAAADAMIEILASSQHCNL